MHNAFLESPLSGTLKVKRLVSPIILYSLGTIKSNGLNRIAKHWLRSPMSERGEP